MEKLNLPQYNFRLKKEAKKIQIFDELRRKFVPLTPEEWVRQNVTRFLISEKKFPVGLMNNEVTVVVNEMRKRCDTVLFDRLGKPIFVAEYKAPSVKISQATFDQAAVYATRLGAKFLLVSNGKEHFFCKIDFENRRYVFFQEIPDFQKLTENN